MGNVPCKRMTMPLFSPPILCLIFLLLCWVGLFLTGIRLGLGWYSWPVSSIFLPVGLVFLKLLYSRKN